MPQGTHLEESLYVLQPAFDCLYPKGCLLRREYSFEHISITFSRYQAQDVCQRAKNSLSTCFDRREENWPYLSSSLTLDKSLTSTSNPSTAAATVTKICADLCARPQNRSLLSPACDTAFRTDRRVSVARARNGTGMNSDMTWRAFG